MPTTPRRAHQAPLPAAESVIRLPGVVERTGRSKASIYKGVAEKTFPAPLQLGPRAVGWRSSDIDAWIAARPVGLTSEPAGPRTRRAAQAQG